jgi:hypothetical protein
MKLKALLTILLIATSLSVNANEISLKCIQVIDDHQHKGSTKEIEMILNIDKEIAFIIKPEGTGKFDENGHAILSEIKNTEKRFKLTNFPTKLILQNLGDRAWDIKYTIDRETLVFSVQKIFTIGSGQVREASIGECAIVENKSDNKI